MKGHRPARTGGLFFGGANRKESRDEQRQRPRFHPQAPRDRRRRAEGLRLRPRAEPLGRLQLPERPHPGDRRALPDRALHGAPHGVVPGRRGGGAGGRRARRGCGGRALRRRTSERRRNVSAGARELTPRAPGQAAPPRPARRIAAHRSERRPHPFTLSSSSADDYHGGDVDSPLLVGGARDRALAPRHRPCRGGDAAPLPVGIGRIDWATPPGRYRVVGRREDPVWRVPASIQAEMRARGEPLVSVVGPGPDNPLGKYWIQLSNPGYGLHGTNAPASVGKYASHGCLRLLPEHAERLFREARDGTAVEVVYEPVKIARDRLGSIFLEVHHDVYQGKPVEL